MNKMKNSSKSYAGLVETYIGTAYDNVKLVADNLDSIGAIGASLTQLNAYIGEKAQAPLLRNDGNSLKGGDIYYDTLLGGLYYYDAVSYAWEEFSATKIKGFMDAAEVAAASSVKASLQVTETYGHIKTVGEEVAVDTLAVEVMVAETRQNKELAKNSATSATAAAASVGDAAVRAIAAAVSSEASMLEAKKSEDATEISGTSAEQSEQAAAASSIAASGSASAAASDATLATTAAASLVNSIRNGGTFSPAVGVYPAPGNKAIPWVWFSTSQGDIAGVQWAEGDMLQYLPNVADVAILGEYYRVAGELLSGVVPDRPLEMQGDLVVANAKRILGRIHQGSATAEMIKFDKNDKVVIGEHGTQGIQVQGISLQAEKITHTRNTQADGTPAETFDIITTEFNDVLRAATKLENVSIDSLSTRDHTGYYLQTSPAKASVANGYPADAGSGLLEVYRTNKVIQRYRNDVGEVFTRNFVSVWGAWVNHTSVLVHAHKQSISADNLQLSAGGMVRANLKDGLSEVGLEVSNKQGSAIVGGVGVVSVDGAEGRAYLGVGPSPETKGVYVSLNGIFSKGLAQGASPDSLTRRDFVVAEVLKLNNAVSANYGEHKTLEQEVITNTTDTETNRQAIVANKTIASDTSATVLAEAKQDTTDKIAATFTFTSATKTLTINI